MGNSLTARLTTLFPVFIAVAAMMWVSPFAGAQSPPTTISYQGELRSNGAAADGLFDLRFRLYTAMDGGEQVGPELTNNGVGIEDGLFTVSLDFGASVWSAPRFLEIDVKGPGDADFVTLAPRQAVSASPYSIGTRGISVSTGLLGQSYIGINTAEPEFPLDVHFLSPSDAYGAGRFFWEGQGASYLDIIRDSSGQPGPFGGIRTFRIFGGNDFATGGAPEASFRVGMITDHPLTFVTDDQPRIFIGAEGLVGIGTSTPTARLHIGGAPGVDGIRFPDGTLQTTATNGSGPAERGPLGVVDFTGNGTFTVPLLVTSIQVEVWGAGGGGSINTNGNPGGGGGYVRQVISTIPGETLTVTIGAGGLPGQAGGATSLSRGGQVVVFAPGGGAGSLNAGGTGGNPQPGPGIRRAGGDGNVDIFGDECPGGAPFAGRTDATTDDLYLGFSRGLGGFTADQGYPGYLIISW